MELAELEPKLLSDLHIVASELGIKNFRKYSKQDLIMKILNEQASDRGLQFRTGLLDVLPDGFGFLRTQGYTQSDSDIYVSLSQIRRFKLRRGDEITGQVRTPKDNEKYHALLKIQTVNGLDPGAGASPPQLRIADARSSRTSACVWRRPESDLAPGDGPHLPAGQGAARVDRLAAQGREDHHPQGDRQLHRREQPGGAPAGAAGGRAAGRGHRHGAVGQRRGGRLHLRPTARRTTCR